MAALAQDKQIEFKFVERSFYMKVAASTTIYSGALVAVNAGGYLIPAADTAGIAVVGVAQEFIDNSAGGNGDLSCEVRVGVYKFVNGTDPIDQTDVGRANAYVQDDQTVGQAAGATNNILVGKVEEIDDDGGVWVAVGL